MDKITRWEPEVCFILIHWIKRTDKSQKFSILMQNATNLYYSVYNSIEKRVSSQNIFSYRSPPSPVIKMLQLQFNNSEEDFPRCASAPTPPLYVLLFKILPSFCPFTQKSLERERCNACCGFRRLLCWTTPTITPVTLGTHLPQAISPHWCNGCVPDGAFFLHVSSGQATVVLLTGAHRQPPEAMDHSSLGAAFQA